MGMYTPGEWELVLGGMDALVVFPGGERIEVGDLIYHSDITVPRARLIAAAPDLLAACESALALLDVLYPEDIFTSASESVELRLAVSNRNYLRAAIAKARGE